MAILQRFSELSMLAFVISSMLAMGISQPLQDVIAPHEKQNDLRGVFMRPLVLA
jgi:hypothetical protein